MPGEEAHLDSAAPPSGPPAQVSEPPETDELERLRAEVAELRGRLEDRTRRHRRAHLARRIIAAVLVAVAGFGVVCSAIGLWGARTTLDTERWVATVQSLPEHPEVTNAMATYLTDQVFTALNVEQRLAEVLPPRATFLAGPVTGAVHGYTKDLVTRFMGTEQFRELWTNANRFAHAQILAILEGRSQTVSVSGSTVTLNLLPVVNNLLITIEQRLPTIFGKRLDLPVLTSGAIPPGLRERIQTAVGVTLPADFAQITMYDRPMLGQLQEAMLTFKRTVVLLIAGSLLALGLALWISPYRRRTLLQWGLWLSISAVVLTSGLRAVRDQLLGLVPDGVYRQGVSVAVHDIFTELRTWGTWLLWAGIVIAVACYLAGPGRVPVWLRRNGAKGLRDGWGALRSAGTNVRLRTWTGRHLDVLRVGGIVVAAVVALILSSWFSLLVVALLLVAYEVLVTLLARGAPPGEEVPAGADGQEPAGRGVTAAPVPH
ncbi:hypothetical protein [Nonomuraea gerenzanensis]|uniref:Putative integral membrane protein n=1 Tax=Nonomuraea gerenzanensis TaxID=93944 RepID=A0A1M4EG58_9ACTN|nr:hypothetical protein [Nonomuraea gerenzanensis]UBU09530.1 hypothetical protein LCN96_34845 [Nonomuraea gerenzanensis]SBO97947.1 putative integral membrane protein [Nonomuraea gerenzanensis]